MKKLCCVTGILMLVFMNGCAMNDDTAVNHDFGVISDAGEISERENGHRETPLPDVCSEADVSGETMIPANERQQDAKSMDSVEKGMLLYGGCDALGCGWLLYTVPAQEDQDYKIYFFADKSRDCEERFKSFEEMDFNLEQADFVFPDVRENNKAIGKFIDIYLYEPFMTESGESAWIAVATYETGGRQYYDTRIYTPSEEGYVIDESMTEEFNALYSDVEEYPVLQIIEMPHD
ncbi:MAG: hypothetical protein NC548_07620 [Lachnospiraceae bacterium]|nr:hypothetical protein [Lachnospiraceae bacterium]